MNIPLITPKKISGLGKDVEIKYALLSASIVGGRNVYQSNIGKDALQMINSGDASQEDVGGNAIQSVIHGNSKQIRIKKTSQQIHIERNASQEFVGEAYMNYVRGDGKQSYVSGDSFMNNIDGNASIQHIKGTAYAGRIGGVLNVGDIGTFKTDDNTLISKLIIDGDIKDYEGSGFKCNEYEIRKITKPIALGHHAPIPGRTIGSGFLPTFEINPIIPENLKEVLEGKLLPLVCYKKW